MLNQKIAKWAGMAVLTLVLGPRAEANTTYTYAGQPFTTFVPASPNPYTTSDFIQVTFTTASPLPAGLAFPTILSPLNSPPATGTLPVEVSIQMTDGGNGPSVDPQGAVGCIVSTTICTEIAVGTDGSGNINQWLIISVTCPNGCIPSATTVITEFGTEYITPPTGGPGGGVDFAARCGNTTTGCVPTADVSEVAAAYTVTSPSNLPGTWSVATQPAVVVTPSPATLGQPITVNVALSGTPTPTGSVQLQVNGKTYPNAFSLANGAATIHIPDSTNGIPDPSLILPVAGTSSSVGCGQNQNSIVIQYSGDTTYPGGTSQPACLTVVPTFAVSPNPAVYGQPVTFSSMIYNPQAPSNITSVVFTWDDGATSPQQLVNTSNGQAQDVLSAPSMQLSLPLSVGTHCCVGVYSLQTSSGQNLFQPGNINLNLVVNKANTATGLTLSQSGSNATLTATVGAVAPGAGTPTGTVSFMSGSTVLATAPLSNGAAMLSLSNFSGNVTAVYPGDGNFNGSASSAVTVGAPQDRLSVSSSLNPSQFGQAVTFTASVTVTSGTGTPTGSVQFLDGTTPIGSATLSGGSASVATSTLAVGSHTIMAQYGGDGVFPGASASLVQVVNRAATTLTLNSSAAQVNAGQSVTLTAQVGPAPPSGVPASTGQISFSSGGTPLGSITVSGGSAKVNSGNLAAGTVQFTATFSGDNNYAASTASVTVTVGASAPQAAHISLSSSLNPSQFGQAVTFTASVSATSATGSPGGSVQFLDGTSSIGSATLAGGSASVTTSTLAVGSHAIAAQYSGDGTFPGASASVGQVVNRIASTVTLNVPSAQVSSGQSVTLTAQAGPAPPSGSGIPGPSGQIMFSAGGTSLGSASISGGSASVTTSSLAAGTVQISASYGGDSDYAGSSATASLNVLAGPLKITTSSLPSGTVNQPYTASVAAIGGTSNYKFTMGGLPPGLSGDASGAISGTPTSGGNFSVTVQVTDNAGATASATLALNVTGLTISATLPDSKQGASYSGSASASGGVAPYKLVITGLPPGLTASVSGGSATVSGQPTKAGTFTVTVQASDSNGASASKQFTVNIAATSLTLGSGSPVGGMAGQPYSQCVAVTGGTAPYTFSATLPAGLSIDPTTGCISGTPAMGGPVTITVTVSDNTGAKTNVTFTVNFALPALSGVNFTGLSNSADPRTQPGLGVAISGPYPADIQGTLTLTFQPANGADTGEVIFSTGSRTLSFTIPANSTTAMFTVPTAALQTGTVAGSITVTASFNSGGTDITPSPAPTKQIQVNAGPPVIVSATASRTSNGFSVSITGYTSTREMTQAMFVFNPASGADLQTTSLNLPVGPLFSGWLQSSQVIGSQFLFTQPFTVSGNLQAVASITITLVNTQGSSQAVTAMVQ